MNPTIGVTPPLPPDVYRRPARPLPFPLGEPGVRLWHRARRGLYEAVIALGLGRGDVILVPAWHHGSEVEALERAGLVPRFYSTGPHLAPDASELEELLTPDVRALHLIHYLGIPQDALAWRRWCDERALVLIEDAAQGWLATDSSGPIGRQGDVAIFSLYKAFGVPDGGATLVRAREGGASPIAGPAAPAPRLGLRALLREHVAWLMSRSSVAAALARPLLRSRPYDPGADFRLDPPDGPSRFTRSLLPRVVDPDAPARRRANYQRLLAALERHVPDAFRALPDGASPYAFPVTAPDRAAAMAHLRDRGVRAVALWSVPHPSLPASAFPGAARWRSELIGLPVHQELLSRHVDQIVDAVQSMPPGSTPSGPSTGDDR